MPHDRQTVVLINREERLTEIHIPGSVPSILLPSLGGPHHPVSTGNSRNRQEYPRHRDQLVAVPGSVKARHDRKPPKILGQTLQSRFHVSTALIWKHVPGLRPCAPPQIHRLTQLVPGLTSPLPYRCYQLDQDVVRNRSTIPSSTINPSQTS